jgi:hypothetical protein
MKTIFATRSTPWLLAVSAATAMLSSGCATSGEHSFNHDFGENLPAEPVYSIQNEDDQHFILRVHQGVPLTSAARTVNVKEAASTVAKAECDRLGWKKWQLNYIQEKDDGWMHVVVAKVDRETYVEPTFPEPKSNP